MDHFLERDPTDSNFTEAGSNTMEIAEEEERSNYNIEETNEPLDSSSESGDSDSNGSENDEREMDEEGKILRV